MTDFYDIRCPCQAIVYGITLAQPQQCKCGKAVGVRQMRGRKVLVPWPAGAKVVARWTMNRNGKPESRKTGKPENR